MIFSLFRCFLPLPLISIPFEYLTMVGAERQCIFFKSIKTMRCEYEFQMKQIPAEDISAILDDGLHLFVKLLLFLFLGISITAHSYIIHWFFNISYFRKLYLLALHYNRQLCCQSVSICKPRQFSLYWPSFKRLYFLSAYLSSMFAPAQNSLLDSRCPVSQPITGECWVPASNHTDSRSLPGCGWLLPDLGWTRSKTFLTIFIIYINIQ